MNNQLQYVQTDNTTLKTEKTELVGQIEKHKQDLHHLNQTKEQYKRAINVQNQNKRKREEAELEANKKGKSKYQH
eukprot:UN05572